MVCIGDNHNGCDNRNNNDNACTTSDYNLGQSSMLQEVPFVDMRNTVSFLCYLSHLCVIK